MVEEQIRYLQFLELVGKLKHLPRKGWVLRNIKEPETVAGHMYRMAMMTFILNDPQIDRVKCMEMALVHDLAESIIGDITPLCGVSKEKKHEMEKEAMLTISKLIGKNGKHVYDLFMEYEEERTPEAKIVKELDLFDMTLQAFEYEKKECSPGRLQEFIDATVDKFSHPAIVNLSKELQKERASFQTAL
ncbi:5'-deoxynucleotidase HDDC2 isoform X2 [Rhodnius prolixus]|uniref:5'-deoxynucleotidase HDDC2 n=2 Tax=Rhodnius TaxID=13248 RepID=T1H8B7_RHOPR